MTPQKCTTFLSITVPRRRGWGVVLLTAAIMLSGCAASLNKSTAGIYDFKTSKAVSVSERVASLIAVDNARREFLTFERVPYANSVDMAINDFNGKLTARKHIILREELGHIRDYAVSPDRSRIALYGITKQRFSICDIDTPGDTVILDPRPHEVFSEGTKWVSNSEIIITGKLKAYDANVIKFNVDNQTIVKKVKFDTYPDEYFLWPEKKYIGFVFADDRLNMEIRIFDPVRMEFITTYKPSNPRVNIIRLCLSPSARRIAYWEAKYSSDGAHQYFITVVDLDTEKVTKFRQSHILEMVFLDEDTLVYSYFNRYSLFSPEVRKLDIKNNLDIAIIKTNLPVGRLMSADNGTKLLFSVY